MSRPYTLKRGKPKAFCCECGGPIWDSVDPARQVVCGDCVQKRLAYFSAKSVAMGRAVKEGREKNGWSQRTFALTMGCSQSFIAEVEKGERRPSQKIQEFLLSVSTGKQTSNEEGLK